MTRTLQARNNDFIQTSQVGVESGDPFGAVQPVQVQLAGAAAPGCIVGAQYPLRGRLVRPQRLVSAQQPPLNVNIRPANTRV